MLFSTSPSAASGSLIPSAVTGRPSSRIEFDPLYCDVIVRRFEAFTGKHGRLAETGATFEDLAEVRTPQTAIAAL
jgi:hypothetical protein